MDHGPRSLYSVQTLNTDFIILEVYTPAAQQHLAMIIQSSSLYRFNLKKNKSYIMTGMWTFVLEFIIVTRKITQIEISNQMRDHVSKRRDKNEKHPAENN